MKKEIKEVLPPAKFNFMFYIGDRQGCGTIRVAIPVLLMNMVKMEGYQFEADYGMTFVNDLKFYHHYSLIIFQRAATDRHLDLIRHFKTNIRKATKTPIIYEVDDLLWDIPSWNYASTFYNDKTPIIKGMLRLVDGMSVSTEYLKQAYLPYNDNIVVTPNHLPKFMWGDVIRKHETTPNTKKPRILYAGSENHFCNKKSYEYQSGLIKDGGDFGDNLLNFIRKTTDKYQWVFSGGFPLELEDLITEGKIERHPWKNILDYPRHIKSLDIDIWTAPLMKCSFNDGKSNIKALEAIACGCPCVFSEAEPYKEFQLTSRTDNEIIGNIEKLASDVDYRKQVYEHDYEIVKDQLFWEDNNNVIKLIKSYISLFGRKIKDV